MVGSSAAKQQRRRRWPAERALCCGVGLALALSAPVNAQTLPPDATRGERDRPTSQIPPLRGAATTPASSRIGQTPAYGVAAAYGASDTGFDSLNRKR